MGDVQTPTRVGVNISVVKLLVLLSLPGPVPSWSDPVLSTTSAWVSGIAEGDRGKPLACGGGHVVGNAFGAVALL